MPENPAGPRNAAGAAPASGFDNVNVGDLIADKYKIAEVIGRGGMGVVVAADHVQLNERVALKFLRLERDAPKEFAQRFVREAQVMAKFRSEHVARIRDFGVMPDGTPYMVMEFLEGIDIRQVVRKFGKLPVDKTLDYVVQACEGLAEAHAAGVVHRDLKPSNLFLTRNTDGSDLIKILDFGVAKMVQDVDQDELTSAGMLLGSPRYMSPQQLRGSHDVDARADVWSLGAMMYEMLVGHAPFLAQTTAALCVKILGDEVPPAVSTIRSDVPAELDAVIFGCLERDLDKRIPDVATLANRLASVLKKPWLDASAARVVAVLGRTAMSKTGSHSSSGSVPRPEALAPLFFEAQQITTMPSAIVQIDDSGPEAGEPPRKRGLVAIAVAVLVLAAGVGAFFALRRPAVPAPVVQEAASSSASVSATAQPSAPDAQPPEAPVASVAPPEASAAPEPKPGRRHPGVWTVAPKAPPTATQATPPATTTRPPVNPLDDRQ